MGPVDFQLYVRARRAAAGWSRIGMRLKKNVGCRQGRVGFGRR